MNWVQRKIFLYNVTFGLYMLDWWERCLFNMLVIVLMWFIFYNSSRYVTVFLKGDASEGWNCVCYTVVSLAKTLPLGCSEPVHVSPVFYTIFVAFTGKNLRTLALL
ncbi:hypothetical protein V6Z11_A01G125900 [Gossypium hirsutum]